jgi:MarR family transcriptional regulator, organic hydroperoxide resistance regulator
MNDVVPTQLDPADARLATEAWLSVVQTYNQCSAALTRALAPLGLSVLQHEMLMNLLRTPGMSQQQLAERCFSAKSGISMQVAAFEKDGVIVRKVDPKDARARLLDLTTKGADLASRALGVQTKIVDAMTSGYDRDELADLKRRMDEIAAILKGMAA